jgi:hypothetical protein
MKKYFIEKLKTLRQFFVSRRLKRCKHGFEISEVINTKIDPTCKKCGQSLSALANVC